MSSSEVLANDGGSLARWRLWALVPIVLLVGAVSLFAATGGSLVELIGQNAPQADEFDVRRVEFEPGEIRVRVTNPQQDELTIATVTVDDAIVPFELDGPATLDRLRSSTIVIPFDWVEDEPISIGVTSSTGIQTVEEIPAAVETPEASPRSVLGYGIIGFLVGVVPVALGLLWLPSLRQSAPEWLAAFMALTGGLLAFLAVEALSEALALQAAIPSALGGAGLVLLGVAVSYLTLTFISHRFGRADGDGGAVLRGVALATLVAIGIGLHNFGEGLAIGSSFALGELALGTFLIVGFMVHNVTEGLGIAAPIAEGKRPASLGRLAALVLIAGAPAIFGAWLGGFLRSDVLGVVFFAAAAGAALEVVVEVARFVARRAPGGLTSGYVLGGFLAGIAIMYVTGLFAG
jgi:zinc transporter, ZIP family